MAAKTSHEYHPVVRNGAWPVLLAAGGALLGAVLGEFHVSPALTAPILAVYSAFCGIMNPTAGTDQAWLRIR